MQHQPTKAQRSKMICLRPTTKMYQYKDLISDLLALETASLSSILTFHVTCFYSKRSVSGGTQTNQQDPFTMKHNGLNSRTCMPVCVCAQK